MNWRNFLLTFSFLLLWYPHFSLAGSSCALTTPCEPTMTAITTKKILEHSGFKCDGFYCKGAIPSYPEPVVILIPNRYSGMGKVHFHFHGHNGAGDAVREKVHFNTTSGDGDYLKFANDARFDGLLVFPLSKGKCDTFKNQIHSGADLLKINSDIENLINIPTKSISLSFHSGADVVASKLLGDPTLDSKLKGAALFDSLYNDRKGITAALQRWQGKPQSPVFQSYFIPGSSTATYNSHLQNAAKYGEFFPTKGSSHMSIMSGGRMTSFFEALEKN